ncbi:heat shock protein beta-9 [Cyclopterus lumpus]|uniref:heat shock protein beta-9 n=1 Tax=Cyclopterus lumpus TaxID=8103 RepID=UPI001486E54E|nr:heat shock protein beta-9 [Cyclopterus lumpus]
MMSQHAALSGLFGDDPFFSQDRLLWPLHHKALSSLQQDFFNKRTKVADSLLGGIPDRPHLLKFSQFPLISSTLMRLSDAKERETPSTELHKEAQLATANNSDLLVTLDARGYAPNDITVKLEGRSLAVVAMKQAGAEESQSCASSSSSASFCSSSSSQIGFVQKIDLPPHLDLTGLSCSLMDDGQLRIHAPVAKRPISEEQEPVRFRTSLEFPISKDKTEAEQRD